MNRTELIEIGIKLQEESEVAVLCEQYEIWKRNLQQYFANDKSVVEQCRVLLHVVDTPYESEIAKKKKYCSCIKKMLDYLKFMESKEQISSPLEAIICNFGLYLKYMYQMEPENKATLNKQILEQIKIENEYDLQHMMYALVKALYPSARREVNQDTGYATVRFDIVIEEIDTVIELKCTRENLSENKLYRELGEDGYFYKCSKLILYVYDKHKKIRDVNNFVKSLERTKEMAGKDVKVYVEQVKELV